MVHSKKFHDGVDFYEITPSEQFRSRVTMQYYFIVVVQFKTNDNLC